VLRGGAQAVGAPVQLTEVAVAAIGGDQGHASKVICHRGDERVRLRQSLTGTCTSSCPVKFAGV
jgi:hypothetical protein